MYWFLFVDVCFNRFDLEIESWNCSRGAMELVKFSVYIKQNVIPDFALYLLAAENGS